MMSDRSISEWRDCNKHDHGYEDGCYKCRVEELEAENERLRAALNAIASCKDQTLLGCAPDNEYSPGSRPDEERAHEYGAYKAFNQCAGIALAAALEDSDESPD